MGSDALAGAWLFFLCAVGLLPCCLYFAIFEEMCTWLTGRRSSHTCRTRKTTARGWCGPWSRATARTSLASRGPLTGDPCPPCPCAAPRRLRCTCLTSASSRTCPAARAPPEAAHTPCVRSYSTTTSGYSRTNVAYGNQSSSSAGGCRPSARGARARRPCAGVPRGRPGTRRTPRAARPAAVRRPRARPAWPRRRGGARPCARSCRRGAAAFPGSTRTRISTSGSSGRAAPCRCRLPYLLAGRTPRA